MSVSYPDKRAHEPTKASMRVVLLTPREDWTTYLYRNLKVRFEVEHCILPSEPNTDRKWKRVLLIMEMQLLHVPVVLRRIISARGRILLVCQGSHYTALVSGLIARLFCMKPRIFLYNFYIHELGTLRLVRGMLWVLLSQGVGLFAQSPAEAIWFRSISLPSQVDYYPYCQGYI